MQRNSDRKGLAPQVDVGKSETLRQPVLTGARPLRFFFVRVFWQHSIRTPGDTKRHEPPAREKRFGLGSLRIWLGAVNEQHEASFRKWRKGLTAKAGGRDGLSDM